MWTAAATWTALAAYSALNFGHGNPTFIDVAKRQLDRLTLTSRAAHSDWLGPFAQKLARLAARTWSCR